MENNYGRQLTLSTPSWYGNSATGLLGNNIILNTLKNNLWNHIQ